MIDNDKLWQECLPAVLESGHSFGYLQDRVLKVEDTLPKMLIRNVETHPADIAMRKKDLGIWSSYTWQDVYDKTAAIAVGLKCLGLKRGGKVSIIGDNDPEWYWISIAVQSLGAVSIGLYIDSMPSDIEHIVLDSESTFVFAKDQEQVDKFLEIEDRLPGVERVVYWDSRGMFHYQTNSWLLELGELMEKGEELEKEHPGIFHTEVKQGSSDDLAVISYTSGTTSLPKGAMLSQEYLIKLGVRLCAILLPQETDDYLSFVPPAWILEQLMMANWLIIKTKVNFPEKPETVMENIREIGIRVAFLGPMQWQSILSQVQMKIFDTGFIRRLIYSLSMKIGYRFADARSRRKKSIHLWLRALYLLADICCLYHIRDFFGLSKLRFGLTGGTALGPDVIRWFNALGVTIKEGYGMTELTPATFHRNLIKPGTSGPPAPGVEVKIAPDGEIYLWSDVVFSGYYNKPEKTREALTEDGWIKTGDCGAIDEDGHLIIYDRIKDMLPLKGGESYSPTYIQNRLKFSPYIKETMVVGGEERDFIFAIITIDFDNVGKWAEKKRISYTTFVDLSQKDDVYELIERDVFRVNETLAGTARIGRFTLLHKEFDADEAELTRTRKIRRGFLEERYRGLIEAAYRGEERVTLEADVKYRDGRQKKIETELKIRSLDTRN